MAKSPVKSINFYLEVIWLESKKRNYNFDKSKFEKTKDIKKINVTQGQVHFEVNHLSNKLKIRDIELYNKMKLLNNFEIHPLFKLIEGEIEPWEKT